jgi:hypothetical protein
MERVVIALYRPKKGKEKELKKLVVEQHLKILREQQLVTDRKPVIMQAADNTIVEVFEWKSKKAIEEAHSNPAVQKLWEQFSEVCDYEVPVNVKEFQSLFSEFEPVN